MICGIMKTNALAKVVKDYTFFVLIVSLTFDLFKKLTHKKIFRVIFEDKALIFL